MLLTWPQKIAAFLVWQKGTGHYITLFVFRHSNLDTGGKLSNYFSSPVGMVTIHNEPCEYFLSSLLQKKKDSFLCMCVTHYMHPSAPSSDQLCVRKHRYWLFALFPIAIVLEHSLLVLTGNCIRLLNIQPFVCNPCSLSFFSLHCSVIARNL